jgi:sulfite reductase beta subunit-like hemoprotein
MSKNERIKWARGLFFVSDGKTTHTFADELDAMTRGEEETIGGEAKELSKFFGIYRQQIRGERGRKSGEHVFMVRIKCPAGGELTAKQWAALDDAAENFADGTIRITSRQGVQYHGVTGPTRPVRPEPRLRGSATLCLRRRQCNVMARRWTGCGAGRSARSRAGGRARCAARAATSSRQVFLSDAGRTVAPMHSEEPLYGPHYLPRKFKVGIAHPDDNSIDA